MSTPVALITGGSSGIGAATARQLVEKGYGVAVTGRGEDRLAQLAEKLGNPGNLLTIPGDTSDFDTVHAAVNATVEKFGQLDTVVANAGYATQAGLIEGEPDELRDMILTNVLGPVLLIKAALRELKKTRGRIVIVGSVLGHVHTPGNIYGMTKWAMTGLAENVRLLVTGEGVGVTLISPGRVDTAFWDNLGGPPADQLLVSSNIADSIVWAMEQPAGVDVNTLTVRPIGQER